MKLNRNKILAVLWICVSFATAQASGVCISGVAQWIANGVMVPVPYATVALCTAGSTSGNCVANKVSIYTSVSLGTATPTNPFVTDTGANYFFCAPAGHYGLLTSSSYGPQFVPDIALADTSSSVGTITGVTAGTGLSGGGTSGNVTVSLTNTSTTVNGQTCVLGGSCTVTSASPVWTCNAQGCYTIDSNGVVMQSFVTDNATSAGSYSYTLPYSVTTLYGIGCTPYVPSGGSGMTNNTRYGVKVSGSVIYFYLDNSGFVLSCNIVGK